MLALIGLDHMAPESLAIVGVVVLFAAILVGFMSDSLMGELGFGPFGNGMLAVMGAFVGAAAAKRFLPPIAADNMMLLVGFTAACALGVLLSLAFVKRFA